MKTIKRTGGMNNRSYIVKDAGLEKRCENLGREMAERRKNKTESEFINPESPSDTTLEEATKPETQEEKLQAFNEARQKKENEEQGVMELAAQNIISRIMSKNSFYNEDELTKDLINIIKNITTKDIIEKLVERVQCPLINKPGWKNCGEQAKGETEYCQGGNFTKCPAFDRYVAFEIIARPQRKKVAPKKKN